MQAMAQALPGPSQAKANDIGLAYDFFRPKPAEARPSWARTSLGVCVVGENLPTV